MTTFLLNLRQAVLACVVMSSSLPKGGADTDLHGEGSLVSCGRDSSKSSLGPTGLGRLFLKQDFPTELGARAQVKVWSSSLKCH